MHFDKLYSFCPVCGSSDFINNNEKSKRCLKCGFVMYMNPSSAVAAFIVNENNELLTCVRAKEPAKDTLDLPGGFVDFNETAEQAVTREIKEELNGDVTDIQYLFSLPNEYIYSGLSIPTLDMFFSVKLKDYNVLKPSDDVANFLYIRVNELNPELFGLKSIKNAILILKNKAVF